MPSFPFIFRVNFMIKTILTTLYILQLFFLDPSSYTLEKLQTWLNTLIHLFHLYICVVEYSWRKMYHHIDWSPIKWMWCCQIFMHTPAHLPGLLIPRCSSIPKPTVLPPHVHSQLMTDLCFWFTEKMHEIRRNHPHTVLSVSDHSVFLTITRHVLLLSIKPISTLI